jgi:hypothetical protein
MSSKIVGCLAALILLQACTKPQPEVATTDQLGGPTPGPIIDTEGGAGGTELTYGYDGIAVNGSSGASNLLDPRFFAKTRSGILVDCGGKKVQGLKKNDTVTYTFDDGQSFSVTIGAWDKDVVWTCSTVGTLQPGKSGDIPECMTTKGGSRKISSVQTNTNPVKTGDTLIIHTNK